MKMLSILIALMFSSQVFADCYDPSEECRTVPQHIKPIQIPNILGTVDKTFTNNNNQWFNIMCVNNQECELVNGAGIQSIVNEQLSISCPVDHNVGELYVRKLLINYSVIDDERIISLEIKSAVDRRFLIKMQISKPAYNNTIKLDLFSKTGPNCR